MGNVASGDMHGLLAATVLLFIQRRQYSASAEQHVTMPEEG